MNKERRKFYNEGLKELPNSFLNKYLTAEGENGEVLSYDEAEVWKRVLNYRIAKEIHPYVILETHAGKGLSTELYRLAFPKPLLSTPPWKREQIISCSNWEKEITFIPGGCCDIIDIDPFGHPYSCINACLPKLKEDGILMVSNGEMLSVVRHLVNTQRLKTEYYGKTAWKWVLEQYLPYLEKITNLNVQFFYVFPTTVRVILSNKNLDKSIFKGCKQWMWWLEKYVDNKQHRF